MDHCCTDPGDGRPYLCQSLDCPVHADRNLAISGGTLTFMLVCPSCVHQWPIHPDEFKSEGTFLLKCPSCQFEQQLLR